MSMTRFSARPGCYVSALLALGGSIVIGILFVPLSVQPTEGTVAVVTAHAIEINLGIPYFCGSGLSLHRCTLEDITPECKADQTKCTPGDKKALDIIARCAADSSFSDLNGASYGCSDVQTAQSAEAAKLYQATVTSCASVLNYMASPFTCMFRTFVSLTAAALIWISSWILAIAGLLFNWLLDNTVIQFGTFYGTIKPAVETAWTAFRDIANILIIGIFTFIAISIILGLKEFGQKKMIAHVLIIAVLINFSLLFTKMIIDGSNYTAAQIYTAAALGGTGGTSGGAAGAASTGTKYGIADQFLYLLGVGTGANAFKTINDSAEAQDSGWLALGHGILVMMVVLGAAVVLFYGCFLLVSRMIMLIFLMVTASIAFASYLIPKWSGSSYGWGAWWSSLLWCAAFAPVLMLMLWMTLSVSYALKSTSSTTLGIALSNPTTSSISALFNYILILGLLFGTFKISSMWSNKIGGFSFAKMATALPFTMGSRFLAGGLGRLAIGAPAYFRAKDLSKEARAARDAAALAERGAKRHERAGNFPLAEQARTEALRQKEIARQKMNAAGRASSLADSRFNIMDTGAAKAVMGAVGVKGFAAGASSKAGLEKSIADQVKSRAEKAEKLAAKMAPSADQNDTAKEERAKAIREERKGRRDQLEAMQTLHKDSAETAKKSEQLADRLKAAIDERDDAAGNRTTLDQQLQSGQISAVQHSTQMQIENQRIQQATTEADNIQGRINKLEEPLKIAQKALHDFDEDTKEAVEKAQKEIVATMAESAADIAQKIGAKQGDILTRAIGTVSRVNKAVADETKDIYKKKVKTAGLRDVFASVQGDAPPPTPPPTP